MPESAWSHPREGKRVVRFPEGMERTVTFKGEEMGVRYRMELEVSERMPDAKDHALLLPLVEVDTWITSLDLPEGEVIALYRDSGTRASAAAWGR
ncbi:hypothetical protein METESE_11490 [Mesoterricola sediminis]|uniref:Uncharacterized protein n=2 Tax=Mesoterricola sediminis TaxID=2927980 RepID=A0AA48KBS9_9BACT|nr:hypothetical protein METESE_11490 [Mesoterricola sediminis]